MQQLGAEIRANQRATDEVDELVVELLGVNRTAGRCLDILEQHGRMSAGQLAKRSGLTTGAVT
ncbi:MAG: MarR family transcriptional regulator, partial [Solirubrobacterales bacterium]|nr:MarR family transcriptional regulator [Solirubrobacterales bacterium]